jgi:hypothetical protein
MQYAVRRQRLSQGGDGLSGDWVHRGVHQRGRHVAIIEMIRLGGRW